MGKINNKQLDKIKEIYNRFIKAGIPNEYFRKWLVYSAVSAVNNINENQKNNDFEANKNKFLSQFRKEFNEIANIKKIDKQLINKKDDDMRYMALYANINNRMFDNDFTESSSEELAQLIIRLLKIDGAGQIICDLGCGQGNFLLSVCEYMKKKHWTPKTIMGMEINKQDAFIADALLKVNYPDFYIDVKNGNLFKDELPSPCEFYRGFVFPPFGLRVMEEKDSEIVDFTFTRRNSNELLFIDKLLKYLHHGYGVALVPNCVLYNEADVQYIKEIIKKGWIQGIIELPAGALNFSGVKTSIIVFAKGLNFQNNNGIKLVNQGDIKFNGNYKNYKLPYEDIYSIYENTKPTSINKIIENNILIPSNLLLSNQIIKNGIELEKIADVFSGCKFTISHFKSFISKKSTNTRILTSSNILDGVIDWEKVEYINDSNAYEKYIVHKNDIIITSKSSKVKILLIATEPKEKLIVTGGMLIVRCNNKKYLPSYVTMYLQSAKGQIALKHIQKGNFIISMSANDLKKVQIPKISLEKQQFISEEYHEKLADYKFFKDQLDKAANKIQDFINSISDEEDE